MIKTLFYEFHKCFFFNLSEKFAGKQQKLRIRKGSIR